MAIKNIFPEDIWDAAVKARTGVSEEYFADHSAIVIARAILAERNRCAELIARNGSDLRTVENPELSVTEDRRSASR